MTSEIRTNSLKSRAGLSTVTFTDSGPMFSGITTFVDNSGFTFGVGAGSSIFTPASNTLTFGTNSNERLRITSGGALRFSNAESLIHTSADTSRLRLFGGSSNSTANGAALALHGVNHSAGNYAVLASGNGGFIRFSTGATPRLQITSGGDINVHNTTAASSTDPVTLDLGGQFTPNASITQANLKLKLYHNGANGDAQGITASASGLSYVSSHTTDHIFYTVPSSINSLVERLRIDSTGQVSIGGNTSVGTKLHIENSSGDAHIRLRGSANCGVLYTRHSDGALIGYTGSGNAVNLGSSNLGISASLSGGDIVFQTGGTASSNERARINSSGMITLGNPTNTVLKAEVCNSVSGHYFVSQCDDNNNGFEIYQQHGSTASRNTLAVYDNRSGAKTASFLVRGDGNVGIATDGTVYGRLSVAIPSQSGGSALQVMNSAVGSGDGSLTNIVLRSVNNLGTQWSMAEYRAQYHMFSNQGTEAFRTQVSGDYGSIETRSTKSGYGGYGIVAGGANHVFMGDGSGAGLYNDTNNGWYIYGARGGDTYLYSNGSPTFRSYVTGDYGCVQTTGTKNGWGGLSISGQYNFMSDGGACGIYNDIDNEWMSYFARNGAFILYNNGVGVLTSDGSGPIVPGGHHFKINAGTWTGEHVGKIQYHSNNLYNQYSSYWIARNASGTNTFTIDSSGNFSSDARKKENITTVTDALTKVSQLRGVEFNWKEKYGSKEDMGLIAQEVETVFPRLISDSPDPEGAEKENKDGTPMKMMNYNGLFAVTVEAIKELKSKIETLEGESLKLKEENAALRERVTNLEGE